MKRLLTFALCFAIYAPLAMGQTVEKKSIQGLDATGDDFVYFNLTSGEIIAKEAAAFGGWDIAFQGTNIQVNGEAQFVDSKYDELVEAPADGFLAEESGPVTLPSGGTDGWFNYDFNSHVISPIANRLIVVKTKGGQYAKLEILDYYKVTFGDNGPAPAPRYYTFKYALQTAKGRSLIN
ncbi:hypothetical protein HQ496_01515 [bacterium]|nr:hypothetical protein [bacterium]